VKLDGRNVTSEYLNHKSSRVNEDIPAIRDSSKKKKEEILAFEMQILKDRLPRIYRHREQSNSHKYEG
jgi:hypothetical protein